VPPSTLGRAADDFVARVLLVGESAGDPPVDASQLRAKLLGDLAAVERSAAAQQLEPQELDDARFALVVWADEMLLKASWAGRDAWSHDLLQMQLYRTNRGGDEFYERLARLRPDQGEARLVYFLCLVLGFEGQLVGDEAARRALIQQHYDMLRAAGMARDLITTERLTPGAYDLDVRLERPSAGGARRIVLGWSLVAVAVFGLAWSVLRLVAQRVPLPPGG
jgi:type VI secretion system protein ImpK